MARVTVEDCIEKINNRFELIIVASQRARELSKDYFPEEFTSARGNGLDMDILGAYERDEWNLFPKQKTRKKITY